MWRPNSEFCPANFFEAKIKNKSSYAKSLSQVKSNISMFINESRDVITDPKTVADMLQNQFLSVFSDPTSLNIK